MVKLKDVARRAGVSEATASLVLNNRPGVSEESRKRVLRAAEELGYTPNAIARNLATRRSRTIGLVVTDINNPFFGALTRFVDQFVKAQGYGLILSLSNDDVEKEDAIIEDFIGKMVEGVLVVPTVHHLRRDFDIYERLQAHGIPFLFLSSYYPGLTAECIMGDLAQGSYLLTCHLLESGRRDVRFLAVEDLEVVPVAERLRGVRRAVHEAGASFDTAMVIRAAEATYQAGYEAVRKTLLQGAPEGIMAMNDIMALGASRAVMEAGLAIPGDVAVAGYDDLLYAQLSQVPLTTVRQDIESMCNRAVERLFYRIETGEAESPEPATLVETTLLVRESTGHREASFPRESN